MKATTALFSLMIFAVLLETSGVDGYSTLGGSILTSLSVLSASGWIGKIIILSGGVILTGLALYFGSQTTLTLPLVTAMLGFLSLPVGIYGASGMPYIIQVLISGTWLFLMISGIGGAIRGDL